jgi:hypothetical protein
MGCCSYVRSASPRSAWKYVHEGRLQFVVGIRTHASVMHRSSLWSTRLISADAPTYQTLTGKCVGPTTSLPPSAEGSGTFKQCMPSDRVGVQQFILIEERAPHSLLHAGSTSSMAVVSGGDSLVHFSECEKEGGPYKWRVEDASSPVQSGMR